VRPRDRFKELISGTRLEPLVRRLLRKPMPQRPEDQRGPAYDRQTIEVMRLVLEPGSGCVDTGAFKGLFLKEMLGLAPRGHHYAFEPLPHLAAELRHLYPDVDVMQVALSDSPGQLPFRHVLGGEGYSGFFRRPYDTYEERVEMINVDVKRLDDVLPRDYVPRFVKVDVEGSEAKVFGGGSDLLTRSRPFVAFETGWDPQASYETLVEGAGLRISLLASWLDGRDPLSKEEFLDETLSGRNYFFLAHPDA